MLIGCLSAPRPLSSPSSADSVMRVRALTSMTMARASLSSALMHASRSAPVIPWHSRSIAFSHSERSLDSWAHASLRFTFVMPVRPPTMPVIRPMAAVTRARSVVNSTLPLPLGNRASPIMSPGPSRSNRVCAVRRMARDDPVRRLFSSTTNNSRRPVVARSLELNADSRAVVGVALPGTVDTNCSESILRGWPLTCRSKSSVVKVGTGRASRSITLTSISTSSVLVSNVGRGSCGGCCCAGV